MKGLKIILWVASLIGLVFAKDSLAVKLKIAVLPFDETLVERRWIHLHPGIKVTEGLINELVNSKKFIVIERAQLKKILDEQVLGESGILDSNQAAKLGKIAGVKRIIFGKITEFNVKIQDLILVQRFVGQVTIDARMVDTETAEILSAVRGTGSKVRNRAGGEVKRGDGPGEVLGGNPSEIVLKEAIAEALKKIVDEFTKAGVSIEGKIIEIGDAIVYLYLGADEVVKGTECSVFSIGRELRCPDTDEVLGTEKEEIATIKIIEVFPKYSIASIVESTKKIKKGDIVRIKTPTPIMTLVPEPEEKKVKSIKPK